MKKIYLAQVKQFNEVSYIGSVDPRKLVRMVDQTIEVGQVQEDQRPLDKKHIKEIAKYVGEDKGFLPTSIIVGTKDKKLAVETEKSSDGKTLYYMMIPETENELKQYENTIDISDGQHRVFAFSDDYRSTDLKDDDVYEVPVTFYIMPQLITRQRLFYTTNAKQKPVPTNLLMWLQDKLKMLSKPEEIYLPIVRQLNSENTSPLKGRIIMSAEKINKGFKAKQLVKILDKAKINEIGTIANVTLSNEDMIEILSEYLSGWEQRYNLEFKHPNQDTMTKISGLRYILLLFPAFVEIAVNRPADFTIEFVIELIKELEEARGIDSASDKTLFSDSPIFRGESATIKQAEEDGTILKAFDAQKKTQGHNPFKNRKK